MLDFGATTSAYDDAGSAPYEWTHKSTDEIAQSLVYTYGVGLTLSYEPGWARVQEWLPDRGAREL